MKIQLNEYSDRKGNMEAALIYSVSMIMVLKTHLESILTKCSTAVLSL